MIQRKKQPLLFNLVAGVIGGFLVTACANVPGARDVFVPDLVSPEKPNSINRTSDAVIYAPLGPDILRPQAMDDEDRLPNEVIGPFEMRNETLASALQFVLDEYDIPLAIETDAAMQNTITVSNLKGPVTKIVQKLCSLAELYCGYEDRMLVIKDTETFTVALPPLGEDAFTNFSEGLSAVTGVDPVVDATTRSMVYTANQKIHEKAMRYFDRLRNNTALIVFETHVWEVTLSNRNQSGIDWTSFTFDVGKVATSLTREGAPSIQGALGIGAQYTSSDLTFDGVFEFLATQGAVKTVSQPQITVLSGSDASMEVGNSRDYISEITRSTGVDSNDNISVTTNTLETGLTLNIESAWDNATVYGNLDIELRELVDLTEQEISGTNIQLPETSVRNLKTRIRIRPGDALLIGGIVTERDDVANQGLGFMQPFLPTSASTEARNTELVIMMRPRVIVYTDFVPENMEPISDLDTDQNTFRERHVVQEEKEAVIDDNAPADEAVVVEELTQDEEPVMGEAEKGEAAVPKPAAKPNNIEAPKEEIVEPAEEKPAVILEEKHQPVSDEGEGEYIYEPPVSNELPAFEPTPLVKEELTEFTKKVKPKRRAGQTSELTEVNRSIPADAAPAEKTPTMSQYLDGIIENGIEP